MVICFPYFGICVFRIVFLVCVFGVYYMYMYTCGDPYNETWTGYPHLDDGFPSETVGREDGSGFFGPQWSCDVVVT
jgi:hypothetical protein